jgi:hypothetical protein
MTAKSTGTKKSTAKAAKPDATAETVWIDGLDAAKEQLSKLLGADTEFSEFHKENYEAIVESATAANDSFEKIASESVAFQQKAIEDAAAIAKQTMGVSSIQEAVEIQGQYAKSAVEAYSSYMSRLGGMWTEGAQASVQPLTGRAQNLFHGFSSLRG